jgi:pimeloyl-ACP methyl ester carboxylesterase
VLHAGGHDLEARYTGPTPPTTPALVFLHEGLGSVSRWRDFPDQLSASTGLTALVYSRAGYGRSDPVPLPRPLDYMQHEGEHVLPEVLDRAGIREAILIGHSDGGSIALVHAATTGRTRTRALLLEAPHVFVEDLSVQNIDAIRARYLDPADDLRDRLAKHHQHADVAFWGWNRAWLDPGFRAAFNLERYLEQIRCPTLLIQGTDDPYGTSAQLRAIERGIPARVETHELEACGHAPHRDRPERVLELMTRFIAAARER